MQRNRTDARFQKRNRTDARFQKGLAVLQNFLTTL